jgi:UDP-glucose 4-epimerase
MARVLITGGAGNLGRLCVAEFGRRGYDLTIFDRYHPDEAPYPWHTDWPVCVGELWDGEAVSRAFDQAWPDIVVHLGANPLASDHPRRSAPGIYAHYGDVPRDDTAKSNILGTYYVLDCAATHGVQRIVAASSFYVLGLGNRISAAPFAVEYLPIDERHPSRPEDTYSLSKHLDEEMYRAYVRAYGMTIIALRLLGVYYRHSPEPPGRFRTVPRPPRRAQGLEDVWMYVDGRDAARAFLLAAEATSTDPFATFYIASGRTIRESPRKWLAAYYPCLRDKIVTLGEWDNLISIEQSKRVLGYEPEHFWLDEYPELEVHAAT